MDQWESLAKGTVEAILDGARMEYRGADKEHGDGLPRHDFWLHRPDQPRAALEVTSVQDEDRTRTEKKLQAEGFSFPANECEWTWSVRVQPDTRVGRLQDRLDGLLSRLEAEGVRELRDRPIPRRTGTAGELYEELAVQTARAHPGVTPPKIHVLPGGTGGYVHAEVVYETVGSVPRDKWEKLGEVDVPERHLFVVLTEWAPGFSSIQLSNPTGEEPEIQRGVTHLWAAARHFSDYDTVAVWRASDSDPWRSVGPVDLS